MIDYTYRDLFKQDSIRKNLKIKFSGGIEISNSQLYAEQFTLSESLCSEETLMFGCCEASKVEFTMTNVAQQLVGQSLEISMVLENHNEEPFLIGTYYVESDKASADHSKRTIVAYDMMYTLINKNVLPWYNNLNFPLTIKAFRDSLMSYLGIEQVPVELINDNVSIPKKTIDTTELSCKDVLAAICELNGCFGHITRDNKFKYVVLEEIIEGLYPSETLYPSDDLFPRDESVSETFTKSKYRTIDYQDYPVNRIDKLIIKQDSKTTLISIGIGGNAYIIESNFLTYDLGSTVLTNLANNLYNLISIYDYWPCEIVTNGNPCLEVGDSVRCSTSNALFYTYIFQRTIKGIQALTDTFISEGEEYRSEDVNSIYRQISKLEVKTDTAQTTANNAQVSANNAQSTANTANYNAGVAKSTADGAITRIENIESDYIRTNQLNAVSARIGNLEADHVSTSTITAMNATINGKLSASDVTANYIAGKFTTGNSANFPWISCTNIKCSSGVVFDYEGATRTFKPKTININGTNYRVLAN